MEFFIKVLIVYGISAIITQSRIFRPLREWTEHRSPDFWNYLTSCMQCLPFWVGVFVSLLLGPPLEVANENLPGAVNLFFTYLFSGALYSGTSMFIHTVQTRVKGKSKTERKEITKEPEKSKGMFAVAE